MARPNSSQRITVALAIALAAGTAAAAGSIGVAHTRAGSTLSLDGSAFHQTGNAVLNTRIVALPGNAIAALWTERQADGRQQPMYAIALDGTNFNIVRPAEYTIGMQYAAFDPLHHVPEVPANLAAGAGNELYIVQYVVPPYQAMTEGVAATGATIERYLPQMAQVVRMSPQAVQQVAALPFVRWVGAYHPAYRISTEVFASLAAAGDSQDPARYSIETCRSGPAQQQAIAALVAQLGGQVDVLTLDQYRMEATVTPAALRTIIAQNEVHFVDPWLGPGGTDMDMLRQIGGAVTVLAPAGFLGQGVRGEIFDTGVVMTHQQWNGQAPLIHAANATDSHGQACYAINFGTGTGNAQATGLLPQREQGIFCRYTAASSFGGPNSRLLLNTQATDPNGQYRSSYQTSSVGNQRTFFYTTISAETDNYLFLVDYLSCQSQSNANNQDSRPESWAKNILSVGGIDHQNTLTKNDDTRAGGSTGPSQDGRTKPDLAHAYWDVWTAYSTSATGYGNFSGTSSATPVTAGHFGLLMQMWHEGVWDGFGGGSSVFADRPASATAKALMINNAYRYTWTGTPPAGEPLRATLIREVQGWGMADVGRMYNMRDKTFIVNQSDVLTALQSTSYNLTVPAGEPQLNVTMVYKDPQGNPNNQTQHRVNNVDLKVTSPTGVVYWGNHGLSAITPPHSNNSTPGGAANTKDTVENVFIPAPAAGAWTVEVIAAEVVADGYPATAGVNDVAYALVATGVEAGGGCYPDCDGDGALTLADFGCFQTQFALGNMYADCNGDGALNLADFGCFQTEFALGCP